MLQFNKILLSGTCAAVLIGSVHAKQKPEKEKPNVLFIAIDDLNDWTGFMGGHPQTQTPNMDRLAAQGLVFENAFCAASVCNPSRAALMSGFRPSTSAVYGNKDKLDKNQLLNESLMLNQYLHEYGGYHTLSRGKVYHTPSTFKHTWDEWDNKTGTYGNYLFTDSIPKGQTVLSWGGTDAQTEETPDYLNAKWAAQQLERSFEKPFFMAVGIFRPHLTWQVPDKYFKKFPVDDIILPEIKEDDTEDTRFKPTKDYLTIKKYGKEKEAVQAYLACINYADECVGVILDALEQSKYADNTIVVLWGDHGWHLGEKQRYRKATLWEEAAHMPFIFKAPGITTEGTRCTRPVNLIDLYPTILDLCNVKANPKNDGRSIVPLLKNPKKKWNYPSITTMHYNNHSYRTEKWRYIKYNDGSEELYNHEVDPMEWKNLANDKKYNSIKKSFAADTIMINALPQQKH